MYESRPPASIGAEYLWRERLEPLLWYLRDDEREMVHEGLELAVRAHSGQMRKSGEPFVTHPVEVRGAERGRGRGMESGGAWDGGRARAVARSRGCRRGSCAARCQVALLAMRSGTAAAPRQQVPARLRLPRGRGGGRGRRRAAAARSFGLSMRARTYTRAAGR